METSHIPPKRLGSRASLLLVAAASIWAGGVAVGLGALRSFESTPGATGAAPEEWPSESQLHPLAGRATLVMLVHPDCSCTRASLAELAEVMGRARGRVSAWVLFVQPSEAPHTAAWSDAARIAGVSVGVDPHGKEATRFGALTSGQVVVYDINGHLSFFGGITGARGHAGENMGRDQVIAAIIGTTPKSSTHSVFGCGLSEGRVVL